MKTKKCTGKYCCGKNKPISQFGEEKRVNDGAKNSCKECVKEYYKNYYLENKERKAIFTKEYAIRNKKRITKYQKEWRLKNHKELVKKKKEYRDNNKEKIAKQGKIYRDKNKKKIAEINKEYRSRSEIKERQNKQANDKYLLDINFKLTKILRNRIIKVLKGKNKSLSTMFLIGCGIDYLMYHLQEKFTKGMSWDNHGRGGWEVDHIKPCSLFDLSKKSEQLICFNYTNLQPLWAEDNRKKGNKYNG